MEYLSFSTSTGIHPPIFFRLAPHSATYSIILLHFIHPTSHIPPCLHLNPSSSSSLEQPRQRASHSPPASPSPPPIPTGGPTWSLSSTIETVHPGAPIRLPQQPAQPPTLARLMIQKVNGQRTSHVHVAVRR